MNAIEITRHITKWLRSTHYLVPIAAKRSSSVCEALRVLGVHITPMTIRTSVHFVMWTLTCSFRASLKHKDDGQTKFIKPNSQR